MFQAKVTVLDPALADNPAVQSYIKHVEGEVTQILKRDTVLFNVIGALSQVAPKQAVTGLSVTVSAGNANSSAYLGKPKLAVGQRWRKRNGTEESIKKINAHNPTFPFKASSGNDYTAEGYFFAGGEHTEYDLIELISDAPAQTEPDSEGWIAWSGGDCPVADGVLVDIRYRDGIAKKGVRANLLAEDGGDGASVAFWRDDSSPSDIIAYRLSKPAEPVKPAPELWSRWIERTDGKNPLPEGVFTKVKLTSGGESFCAWKSSSWSWSGAITHYSYLLQPDSNGWIPHHGGVCPLEPDAPAAVRREDGLERAGPANLFDWRYISAFRLI